MRPSGFGSFRWGCKRVFSSLKYCELHVDVYKIGLVGCLARERVVEARTSGKYLRWEKDVIGSGPINRVQTKQKVRWGACGCKMT